MAINKLLFATKFEELWFDALQSILDLKKGGLNHVVFLNVIQRDKVSMRRGSGYQKTEEIKLREKANIRFIDWAETLFEQGMEAGVYIVVGSLPQQVVDAAEKEKVDLIVIGPQKKGKLEKFYSGSDVSEILHRSKTPLLVYKYLSDDGKLTVKPFLRPLLAVDWSDSNERAVDYIKELSAVVEKVHVIHVADEKSLKGSSAMAIQKTRKESRQKLEDICDILESAGIESKPHVYVGNTVSEIEKAARECQATMIVAGTSASGNWKKRWTKSTSVVLAEKSKFPILMVPLKISD